ncbi:MAG: TonB-dependent receptor [Burkholderiales bacterium]
MKLKLLSVIAVISCGTNALAEEVPQADTMVVTANRTEERLAQTLQHTTLITQEQIRNSGAADLPTLLRQEAALEIAQSGGVGKQSSTFMRGANSNHTLVLIDGIRANSATVGATALDQIMLDQIDRIEVVRGNVSSLYGSEAIGGVIQIFTKRGKGEPGLSIAGGYGTENSARFSAGYGGVAGSTRFNVNLSAFHTDGFSAINRDFIPLAFFSKAGDEDDDGYRNLSFSANLSQEFSPGQSVGFTALHSDGWVEFDGDGINSSKPKLTTWSLYSSNQISEKWRSKVTLAQGIDDLKSFQDGTFKTRFKTTNNQLGWQNDIAITEEQSLVAGLEYLSQDVTSTTQFSTTDRTVASGYLTYFGELGPHTVQVNGRYDRYSDFGGNFSGLLGYGYRITEQWRVSAGVSNAFRAPSFNELYDPNFGFGNPNLKPEKARSTELGLQYQTTTQRLKAVIFRTRTDDLIVGVFDPVTFNFPASNVDHSESKGLELSYSGEFGPLQLRASFTEQRSKNRDTGERLLRRARSFGSLGAQYRLGDWRMGGEVLASGNREDFEVRDPFDKVELSGYSVVNLTSSYQFTPNTRVAFRLENAFDKQYEWVRGYNTQGRSLFVSLAHEFK